MLISGIGILILSLWGITHLSDLCLLFFSAGISPGILHSFTVMYFREVGKCSSAGMLKERTIKKCEGQSSSVIVLQQSWILVARIKLERNGTKLAPQKRSLICELNNSTLHHLFGPLEKEKYVKGKKIFSKKTTTDHLRNFSFDETWSKRNKAAGSHLSLFTVHPTTFGNLHLHVHQVLWNWIRPCSLGGKFLDNFKLFSWKHLERETSVWVFD